MAYMPPPATPNSWEQKMHRQRQLALKRQRDMATSSFGVVASQEQNGLPAGRQKGHNWAQFLVDMGDRPGSRDLGLAPQGAPGAIKVVVGRPGASDEEAEAHPLGPRCPPPPQTPPEERKPAGASLESVLLDTADLDEVDISKPQIPDNGLADEVAAHAAAAEAASQIAEKQQPARRSLMSAGSFWSSWKSQPKAQPRRPQFAELAEEAAPKEKQRASSPDEEEGTGGPGLPASAFSSSRAQTPWAASGTAAPTGLSMEDLYMLPGANMEEIEEESASQPLQAQLGPDGDERGENKI